VCEDASASASGPLHYYLALTSWVWPTVFHQFIIHLVIVFPQVPPTLDLRSPHPSPHGHPKGASHISPFFYFCSKLSGVGCGGGGQGELGGPSWVGAGGGVIALSSLSPGGLCGRVSEETLAHKHAGHSTVGWTGGWAPYCTLGVGPGGDPPQTGAWGRGWRLSYSLLLHGGEGETPMLGAGKEKTGPCEGAEGWSCTWDCCSGQI
jgi:hypothetical protein